MRGISLSRFLIDPQWQKQALPSDLRLLIEGVARAVKAIGTGVGKGALAGVLGEAGTGNVQGEAQKKLDVIANEILLEANEWGGHLTLDRDVGSFVLTQESIRIPEDSKEFAINMSNARFREPPVKRYVEELLAGKSGPRGKDFNMRWVGSMVADVFRILTRGGIFLNSRDAKDPAKPGRLRLMYEANPMAFIVEQAGGAATTGRERILDLRPTELHQRVPVILGSRNEVARVASYHG